MAEAYTASFFLRGNTKIKNALDFAELDTLVWNMMVGMKAKDVFSILEEHQT